MDAVVALSGSGVFAIDGVGTRGVPRPNQHAWLIPASEGEARVGI